MAFKVGGNREPLSPKELVLFLAFFAWGVALDTIYCIGALWRRVRRG